MKESLSEKVFATLLFDANGITHQYQCVIMPNPENRNAR